MRVINPIMLIVYFMSDLELLGLKITIIAYLMVEMGKPQYQIQPDTSIAKKAQII